MDFYNTQKIKSYYRGEKYRRKRLKSNIKISDMADYLGISVKDYELIERGLKPMPTKLLERFQMIIKGGEKMNNFEIAVKLKNVDDFYSDFQNNEHKYLAKFNIMDKMTLGRLLGYADGSCISRYKNIDVKKIPYNFKNKVYQFFENELNIQPIIIKKNDVKTGTTNVTNNDAERIVEEKKEGNKMKTKEEMKNKLVKYFKKNELLEILGKIKEKENKCARDIAKEMRIGESTLYQVSKRPSKCSYRMLKKVKDYIDNYYSSLENIEGENYVMPFGEDDTTIEKITNEIAKEEKEEENITFDNEDTDVIDNSDNSDNSDNDDNNISCKNNEKTQNNIDEITNAYKELIFKNIEKSNIDYKIYADALAKAITMIYEKRDK